MTRKSSALGAALRLGVYPGLAALCFAEYALGGGGRSIRSRVRWLQRVAVRHAKWIGMKVRVHGEIPVEGLVVSNHISYLDIVGLSAIGAFAFVSKQEVAQWPVFGAYARLGATIFVNREQRGAVAGVAESMRGHLTEQVPMVLFPEGTSTGGDQVLPFRSSLFDPVTKLDCPVTPCGLRYALAGGEVAEEVAYWRDMSLAPHLLNLLRQRGLTLDIHFGAPLPAGLDRKAMARQAHAEVCRLAGLGEKSAG